jgi:hypothetical protein
VFGDPLGGALGRALARFGGALLFQLTPTNLPGSTFTRSTTGTYADATSTRQTAAINALRAGHYIGSVRTILLEGGATNHFGTSAVPATQTSPSLGTGTYCLWMEGAGSIAVAAGTATITGAGTASAGTPVTFTVTVAGTVTYTPTPTSAAVTRGADALTCPNPPAPKALTGYLKFIEGGTVQQANARVFGIMIGANVNPQLYVYSTGGRYTVLHHNGTGAVTSQAGAAPALGATVELRFLLNADGSVQIGQSINGAAEVVATASAANALAAAWVASAVMHIGCLAGGAAAGTGANAFQAVKLAAGVRSLVELRGY